MTWLSVGCTPQNRRGSRGDPRQGCSAGARDAARWSRTLSWRGQEPSGYRALCTREAEGGRDVTQHNHAHSVKPKVTRPVSMLEMFMQPPPELDRCIAPRMPVVSAHPGRHVVVRYCTPLASS